MSEYTGTRPASDYRAQRRERKKIIAKTQRKLARIRETVNRDVCAGNNPSKVLIDEIEPMRPIGLPPIGGIKA